MEINLSDESEKGKQNNQFVDLIGLNNNVSVKPAPLKNL